MPGEEDIIEAMAESAHQAWWEAYLALGYTSRRAEWGEEFMVPFADLSHQGQEFDRVIMRAILRALDAQGYEVTTKDERQAPHRGHPAPAEG
jgi:hypothetical protein